MVGLGAIDRSNKSVLRAGVLNGLCSFVGFRLYCEDPLDGEVASGNGAGRGEDLGDLLSISPSSLFAFPADDLAGSFSFLSFALARLIFGGRNGFLRTRSTESEML